MMPRGRCLALLALSLVLAGCGDTSVAPCVGTAPDCYPSFAGAGSVCRGSGTPATCHGGAWTCAPNTISSASCGCFGVGDACDGDAGATCAGAATRCYPNPSFYGTDGGAAYDPCLGPVTLATCEHGAWTCPTDTLAGDRCDGGP